ncbi:MAG: RimK family alpha-L-glutamate ligase [Deltaproteobacteria bacterium]|nr:RimK family alpha-L-glutamate ligase [Deltaproteobacteria bacterium]
MKISIISFVPGTYSLRRIRQAALDRKHSVKVLEAFQLSLECAREGRRILLRGKPLPPCDAVIPRFGAASDAIGQAFVRHFEECGTFSLNSSRSIAMARDKLLTMQLLNGQGIDTPASAFVLSAQDIAPAIERLGGPPVIIKVIEGTQGIGVMLAESVKGAEAIFETMQVNRQHVILQKFITESKGKDIRAFVVGGKVVAAMRRSARNGEFRSNFHRGGQVEKVILEPAYETAAIRAAEIMGLSVAGVDILESNDGPKIMELNSSPGLEGIEGATNVNVARAIIEFIEKTVVLQAS